MQRDWEVGDHFWIDGDYPMEGNIYLIVEKTKHLNADINVVCVWPGDGREVYAYSYKNLNRYGKYMPDEEVFRFKMEQ